MEGIFAVYKPKGITSHDVINIIRRKTGIKKVGHAGTLDPLAEGVLVVAIGREFTKQLDKIVKSEKEYIAEIFLGQTSTTDDMEGVLRPIRIPQGKQAQDKKETLNNKIRPNLTEVEKTLKQFIGKIMQTPPQYSAIKVKGTPAYKSARQGRTLALGARLVEIKEIEILYYKYPILKLKIICGKGVYIRSLARDLGEELKTGAYLKNLVRTRVGEFTLEKAEKLEE